MNEGDAPHDCPGVRSETAGKEKACEGCPNASYCSQPKKHDVFMDLIRQNLAGIATTICVMSGKGGVGKSTVCRNLAEVLSQTQSVCILDLDVCGPSIPKLTNTEVSALVHNKRIYPIKIHDTLHAISLANLEASRCLDSFEKTSAVKNMLSQIEFGSTDILVIDTPPNVSDEHLALVNYVKIDHVVIVTTPQLLSLNDVRRQVDFCRKAKFAILGLVSNMSGFVCKCGHLNHVFLDDAVGFCRDENIQYLGAIQLQQQVAQRADDGLPFSDPLFETISQRIMDSTKHAQT